MAANSVLGRSLLLLDGDLVVAGGKLRDVVGTANLFQALSLRILTPLGDDQFNTGYGLDVADLFTRAATARSARDLVQLNLVRTLGTDTRVREIRDVRFPDPPPASRRRSWPVEVTIITVDGDQQTLPLTVGV
jgi:hypothetical protein